jgi:hypothetical protein
LWFGAHGNGGGSLDDWLGDMDEVSFFDRALTDAEVKALFLDPVPNSAPTVTNVTLNSGNNISLVENIMFGVDWTATVTDLNGYPDISTVTGKVYRSGVAGAEACSTNEANCYEDVSCSLSACTGNSCTATCSANIQFFADATDASSSFPSEYWLSFVEATDFSAATGDNHSPNSVNELNTLLAHDVTGTLGYGSLVAGDDTGSSNDTLIVTNTGNSTIDTEISGTDLCTDFPTCSVNIIPVSNQEYSTSAFTYGAGTDLLSTNATIHLNLAKATAAPSNATFTTYWGIGLPSILNTGNYTGNTSFLVTAD